MDQSRWYLESGTEAPVWARAAGKGHMWWVSPEWSLEEGGAGEEALPGGEEVVTNVWSGENHSF